MIRLEELTQFKGAVFRHFRGSFYTLVDIAIREADMTPMVIYRSLVLPPTVWTRPYHEFFEELSEEVLGNTTGQKFRFELVHDLSNIASSVSTEQLVTELFKREDNPFKDVAVKKDNIVDSFYEVGMMQYSKELGREYFETINAGFDTLEEAEEWLQSHFSPLYIIVRRLMLRDDFIPFDRF